MSNGIQLDLTLPPSHAEPAPKPTPIDRARSPRARKAAPPAAPRRAETGSSAASVTFMAWTSRAFTPNFPCVSLRTSRAFPPPNFPCPSLRTSSALHSLTSRALHPELPAPFTPNFKCSSLPDLPRPSPRTSRALDFVFCRTLQLVTLQCLASRRSATVPSERPNRPSWITSGRTRP